jgi:hypothetical protein
VCCIEEYLPGAYVKYSNNNGFVGKETSTTEERERNTPHVSESWCSTRYPVKYKPLFDFSL